MKNKKIYLFYVILSVLMLSSCTSTRVYTGKSSPADIDRNELSKIVVTAPFRLVGGAYRHPIYCSGEIIGTDGEKMSPLYHIVRPPIAKKVVMATSMGKKLNIWDPKNHDKNGCLSFTEDEYETLPQDFISGSIYVFKGVKVGELGQRGKITWFVEPGHRQFLSLNAKKHFIMNTGNLIAGQIYSFKNKNGEIVEN